jgi:hypothetical protein
MRSSTPNSNLVDWEVSGHRLRPAGSQLAPCPSVEPPTIPDGMTIAEYRRARPPRTKHVSLDPFRWLGRVMGFRERRTGLPAAISCRSPYHTAAAAGA